MAESAALEGTTRTISQQSRERIRALVTNTARQIADVVEALWGEGRVVADRALSLSGDNFAEFQLHAPGAYAYLGTANPAQPNTLASNHNGKFDVDEDALVMGAGLYAGYALARLI